MNTQIKAIEAAKTKLRDALVSHAGNTKHEAVIAAIDELAKLNPTAAPTRNESLMDGQWRLISAPNFPNGELQADGKYVYTLGRLAFNMFQPTKLKVALDRVMQPVIPIDNGEQRTHDIIVEFSTVDETTPQLYGIVRNLGICQPADDNTLQVQFTGGDLAPQERTDIEAWKATFGNQSQAAKKSFKEMLMTTFLKVMFGIVPPQKMDRKTGQISFTMKRSPKGKLAILYLDEELRITRGEKGTVLVCERQIG